MDATIDLMHGWTGRFTKNISSLSMYIIDDNIIALAHSHLQASISISVSSSSTNNQQRVEMVSLKQLLATAALLSRGALASPVPSPDASPDAPSDASPALAKRGEGIHLFNCRPFGGAGVSQTWLSIVAVRVPANKALIY